MSWIQSSFLSLITTLYFSYSLHNLLLPQLKHQHLHRQNSIMAVGKRDRGQDPCKHYVVICDYALTCTCIRSNMCSTCAHNTCFTCKFYFIEVCKFLNNNVCACTSINFFIPESVRSIGLLRLLQTVVWLHSCKHSQWFFKNDSKI